MKRIFGVVVVSCVAAAMSILPAAALAGQTTVYAGGPAKWALGLQKKTGAGVDNFLINRVVIHVGDTVVWNAQSLAGGFHTVDIPKLDGKDLPLITSSGTTLDGVKDAAGNPFWFDGHVPALTLNHALFGPTGTHTYNGTSRIDSGLPLGPAHDFRVTFTRVGQYKFFCDVHPGMAGTVVVKPRGGAIPTAAQNARTLAREERQYVLEARRVDATKVAGNSVSVGASGPGGLEVFAMFPQVLHVPVGTTVRFFMSRHTREVHTATFGDKNYLQSLAKSFTQNLWPAYPSDPPGHITLDPTSHGNGFANVGAMDQDPTTPLPAFGAITFTTKGTYNYLCLVHPFMRGEVIVK